jgi:alkylation response protein AidB-like acyl-CoA dehydrogenase
MTRTAVTDADFYLIEQTLDDDGRQLLRRVREFMEKTVQPVINHYWTREEFPFDLMDGFRGLGIPKGFVVERGTPGFETSKQKDKIALRVVQNAHITMDGVRVPEENRLQEANSFKDTAKVLRLTRAGVAWQATGCARGAYEHALAYARQRQQFGRPIGGFQLVQDLLVKMLSNVTASACLCARLSALQQADLAEDHHSALAKAFCTVRMREATGWARELLGGNGILLENHVGRFVADSEAIYSYEGTREINTLIVGRAAKPIIELKQRLAAEHTDGTEYLRAKTGLIQELTDRARAGRGLPPVPVWEE